MLNDTLANAMSDILNAEKAVKNEIRIRPVSKVIKSVLKIMKDYGYIGEIKEDSDTKGNFVDIKLKGFINKCGVIKPRFNIRKNTYEKFEKRYLPAKDFGIIIVSTPKGIMTHDEAKKNNLGGRVLAYCY